MGCGASSEAAAAESPTTCPATPHAFEGPTHPGDTAPQPPHKASPPLTERNLALYQQQLELTCAPVAGVRAGLAAMQCWVQALPAGDAAPLQPALT